LPQRQNAYGFTDEDVKTILTPMAATGYEAIGSMGDDTPMAVLVKREQSHLQLFQTAFCAGEQSTDRSDSRTPGDVVVYTDRCKLECT
jgi:hypothetical protein